MINMAMFMMNMLLLILSVFITRGFAQGTTNASTWPKDRGLVLTTYYTWSRDIKGRIQHLPKFPGYENITGEDAGYDDAITPDIPTFIFKNEDTKMQSIDIDLRENTIFMHDDYTSTIAYVSDYNTDLSNITINNLDTAASRGTAQVAVDWLSHTVYWTDTLFRRILAVPGQSDKIKMGYYKIIVEESIGAPVGIAVDPHEGLLFWSDVGTERKLEKSNLDGSLDSRKTFKLAYNSYPSCLELDPKEKKIYWIERSLDKILYITYDFEKPTLLKGMSSVTLFDMALFRDVLYVSDTYDGYLYTINKTKEGKGRLEADIITYYPHDIYGIAVYSEETQPLRDRDYCTLFNCDQFCISTKESAKCACAEGYSLNPISGKCEGDKKYLSRAIVFANATHICMVDVQALVTEKSKHFCVYTVIKQNRSEPIPVRRRRQADSSTTAAANSSTPSPSPTVAKTQPPPTAAKTTAAQTKPPITKPKTTTLPTTTMAPTAAPGDVIKYFDMDMKNRIFFIATEDNSIYKRLIDASIENDAKELIIRASGNISGIAYDAEDPNNLYWCESDTNNVWVVNTITRAVRKVNLESDTRIDNPRNIIILLKERKLAMITGTDVKDYSITTITLDGKNISVVVSGKNEISAFYYNREEQMFYYNRAAYVYKASPDGKTDSLEHFGISIHTYILFQYQNFIVWVYRNDTHSNIVKTRNTLTSVNMNLVSFDKSALVDMKPLDVSLQKTDVVSPCAYNNGGCSQICITQYVDSKMTRICECPIGYTVENEVNCTTNVVDDNFLVVTDWSLEEMLQIDNITNDINVIPGDVNAEYMGVFVDQDKKRIIWAHYFDEEILSANFNGSDRKVVADLGSTGYAYRFDKDATTGNIYFTGYFDTYLGLFTPDGKFAILNDDFGWDSLLDIAVYPVKGWVYFTLDGYPSYVGRANMDGSNHVQLISGDQVGYPDGLAINHITDRLYWSDATYDTIQDCNMDGQDCVTIVNMTGTGIREEIRDLVTDGVYLYYSTYQKDHVTRVSLKKPYTKTTIGQNYALGKLDSLAIYSSTNLNIQKPNTFCQDRDGRGDCSTICIPTEQGRTCACEDGVGLKTDQRTCENVYQCSMLIEQTVTLDTGVEITIDITMDKSCSRLLHEKCNYECPNNYEPLFDTEMSCTSAGWSMESRTLCKEVRCPTTVDNGIIVGDCKREVGDRCDYQCDTGYVQTRKAAVCTKKGVYHEPEGGFCTPFKCSESIANGMMDKDCTRLLGTSCDYMCNKFYAPNPLYPKAECQPNGWSPDPSSLCQESTCEADSFPYGQFVSACLRKIGDACTFTCKPGYVKTTELAFCKNDKMWHPEDACSAFKCKDTIDNGYLDQGCSRIVGSTCKYYCNKFYDPANKKAEAKCESTGWTPSELCKESICDDGSLANGKVTGACSKKIGENCAIECNQGYVNITENAFCRNDKKWHPVNACTEYTCSDTIENGAIDTSCSRVVGSTCNFTCNKHYNATTVQATCTANGWNPASGDLCQAVSCPSTVPNGRISASCDLTVGSTCDYKCMSGYQPTEVHPNVTCKRTGKWVTDNLCIVPPKGKSKGLSETVAAVVFSVLGVLVVVLAVVLVCIVYRKKKSSSKYSNFDDSSVAIENPGYRQRRSFPDPNADDPYSSVDAAQMKPVTTTSFSSGDIIDDGKI